MLDKEVLGKRIRHEREKQGLTREAFAEKLDISARFAGEIEQGKKGISAETLYKICQNVDVTADYLLLGRQNPNMNPAPTIELLNAIPPEYTDMLEEILRAFARTIQTAEKKYEDA